jgi:hypothetical protein
MDADQQPERRRFKRVPNRISVTLALKYEGWEFQQSVCTVDLSRGGLRIRTEPRVGRRTGGLLIFRCGRTASPILPRDMGSRGAA